MTDDQLRLFDGDAEPWELDDRTERCIATVLLPDRPLGELDYLVPDALCDQVEPGRRVRVPLGRGNRPVVGYCVRVEYRPVLGRRLKAIESVVDGRALLEPSMLRLTRWIAEYYLCDWGTVLETVLPAGVRVGARGRLTTFLSVEPEVARRLAELKLPPKQAAVMKLLAESPAPLAPAQLARLARSTLAPITALRRKGLIRARSQRVESPPRGAEPRTIDSEAPPLNGDQSRALEAILAPLRAGRHETILLHGVTGSGKTEVYIQAIREVVSFGRQAIVLVPEISLTPQTVERFRRRFGRVAVLHSHLSDAERHWHWQRIAEGEVGVIVGARSAVFAPAPQLGLIVVDEEHEASFKQESAPRYDARRVALERTRNEGIPLVLGSATPSLESWHRTRRGESTMVEMPRRVLGRPLPAVATVDLRLEAAGGRPVGAISRPLDRAIGEALSDGGQVILLLNRRGFSTHIQCPACGHMVKCPDCDIALTHHRAQQIALCHYCDYQTPAPGRCPECGFGGIRYAGLGTQRLEAEVRARYPGVACLRMDTDTMQGHGAHEQALGAFRSGEVRILLGTQMIAKGLDFPNVTLVGVVNADTALGLPDFRAAERTFQLVTQVAGRTGRGPKGGRVLVQTYCPDHPAIRAAVRHDYAAFAASELPLREALGYPPFSAMVRLVVRGPVEPVAAEAAAELGDRLRAAVAALSGARVVGPAPAPLARLRGMYRFHIQAHHADGAALRQAAREAAAAVAWPDGVQWIIDVDPLDML